MMVVTFGEIMLRLKSPGQERLFQTPLLEATFGGSEANVAVALARLGMLARFVTLLPDNQIGRECQRVLRAHGVDVSFIGFKKGGRLGIYFYENGANQRASNVIYDRAHSAISEIEPGDIDWEMVFRGAEWFHVSGITPALSAKAADACRYSMLKAREAGLKVSFDLNFRAKLWKYGADARSVMCDLARNADILIGNEEDYQKSLGIEGPSGASRGEIDTNGYEAMCKRALDAFPGASMAAVTLRQSFSADSNDWSAMLVTRGQSFVSRTYRMNDIVDRVGAGDSFAAGLIYGVLSYGDLQKALEYAVALSCLKHTIPGDFAIIEHEEVIKLLEGDATGRVQR